MLFVPPRFMCQNCGLQRDCTERWQSLWDVRPHGKWLGHVAWPSERIRACLVSGLGLINLIICCSKTELLQSKVTPHVWLPLYPFLLICDAICHVGPARDPCQMHLLHLEFLCLQICELNKPVSGVLLQPHRMDQGRHHPWMRSIIMRKSKEKFICLSFIMDPDIAG